MNLNATVAVIGAGQAGLSAAYHLARRGFVSALDASASSNDSGATNAPGAFIVFDAEDSAAWGVASPPRIINHGDRQRHF